MKEFRCKKKMSIDAVLLIVLCLSVIELVSYSALAGMVTPNDESSYLFSVLTKYSYLFDLVNSFTSGYIMSYIFYLVVLIPERKKQQSINRYVGIYLENILRLTNEIVRISEAFSSKGTGKLSDSPCTESVLNGNTGCYEFMSYKDHFTRYYRKITEEYQHLAYYIAFIENDLRDCLNHFITCRFLTEIHDMLIIGHGTQYDHAFENNFSFQDIKELLSELEILFREEIG